MIENSASMERHESCTCTSTYMYTQCHGRWECANFTMTFICPPEGALYQVEGEPGDFYGVEFSAAESRRSSKPGCGNQSQMHLSIFFFQNILCTEVCTTSWQCRHVCEGGVLCFTANIRAESVTAAKCGFNQKLKGRARVPW